MRRSVNKTILNVKPYVPGKPIEEVKRDLGLKEVIKLASNENPYPPSSKVLSAISKASQTINRYPDSDCYYLRAALAKKLNVRPSQLIFGNGSDEIIVLAVRAFVKKTDEVVMAKPSFLIYDIASRLAGANVKAIPLDGFRYNLDGMKKAVTKRTKIVFLGNPDNPSGTYFTDKEINRFLKGLSKDILLFIDEAYYEYVTQKNYIDSIKLLKNHRNVVVTRTFSKMYGLAGLRIGYGVADEELVGYLNRIREPFNVNSIAQAAALACLKDQRYYSGIAKKVEIQKQYLYNQFKQLNIEYVESYTNFILIRTVIPASGLAAQLLRKGIIVRDMSIWGLKNYIRVTVGTEKENMKFISVLERIL